MIKEMKELERCLCQHQFSNGEIRTFQVPVEEKNIPEAIIYATDQGWWHRVSELGSGYMMACQSVLIDEVRRTDNPAGGCMPCRDKPGYQRCD
jgi:hypothetical protein